MNNIITIENAKLKFRNFSGKETQYNREGKRNFCVVIDDAEVALKMQEDGWNVKIDSRREDPEYYIQINVNFDSYMPPKIYKVDGKNITELSEDTVSCLDFVDIASCDIEINPYEWTAQGKKGIKGYLKTMYAVVDRDSFADKYSAYNIPPSEEDDEEMPF